MLGTDNTWNVPPPWDNVDENGTHTLVVDELAPGTLFRFALSSSGPESVGEGIGWKLQYNRGGLVVLLHWRIPNYTRMTG